MLNRCTTKWLALLGGVMLTASVALAQTQDNKALLDILVKKGILTDDEAKQVAAEVAKSQPPAVTGASKYLQKLTFSGRLQTQFVDLGTSVNGALASAHPAATQHFLLRRVYIGVKADLGDGFSGVVNYDFANASFDAAYAEWKQSDAFAIDAGFRKAPFGYEETTSSSSLKAIERSPVTRYFDEPNNGRRLGAASYRTGLFASGTQDGFFYNLAVTNPERNEYSGDANSAAAVGNGNSGPLVNGNGGVATTGNNTNNNFAYYGTAGYSGKCDNCTYKAGIEGGYLPDQGGPGAVVGTGDNLDIYGFFADVTYAGFNLQGEWIDSKDPQGVSVKQDAKPTGYWIQPAFMVVPDKLEAVVRYSYVNSNGRGINLSDGIRSAPSGGTMDKMDEWYIGGNWYIKGKDVVLQAGYIHGESKDSAPTGASGPKATSDGFRSQVQLQF